MTAAELLELFGEQWHFGEVVGQLEGHSSTEALAYLCNERQSITNPCSGLSYSSTYNDRGEAPGGAPHVSRRVPTRLFF
jgi:hypothetical protein